MRRLLLALTVFSLVLPAAAQRGRFVGGTFNGARAGVIGHGRGPIIRTVPPFGFGFNGFTRFGRHGFRHNRFGCFNGFCNGFGFGAFGGYGLPFYVGDYSYDYNSAAYADHALRYDDSRDREINELLLDLRDQQRQLDYLINNMQREQNQQQYQPAQPQMQQQRPGAAPPRGSLLRQQSAQSASNERPQPATTLIFKDGRRMDVHNYVIAKGTLTVLDGGTRQRIALSQIDIPATQKANEDRGVTFKAPVATVSLLCNSSDVSCRPHTVQSTAQKTLTP
jgi:hypothetical protein